MDFEYTEPQSELERAFGGFHSVNAFGTIKAADDTKFEKFLTQSTPPPRTPVFIDSLGGDVETAMNIGRKIRQNWFSTNIGLFVLKCDGADHTIIKREKLPGRCMSAATLIFLGGRLRYHDDSAAFGVHQFSYKNPSPGDLGKSQMLSAKIATYVAEMGASPAFLEISSSTPSTEIKLVDQATLKNLRVVTGGVTDVTWTVQARGDAIYVRGERDSIYGHHKVMLVYARGSGFLFHAVIEAQGRERELTEFSLVEIVLNDGELSTDISERALRFVNGGDVNIIVKLEEGEARAIAYSTSFGVQVRASNEAPVFFGIAPVNTEGGREQLETLFSVLC